MNGREALEALERALQYELRRLSVYDGTRYAVECVYRALRAALNEARTPLAEPAAVPVMEADMHGISHKAVPEARERRKCIVKGCQNHADEGRFVGDLCSPCHLALTTGQPGYGNSWIQHLCAWEAWGRKHAVPALDWYAGLGAGQATAALAAAPRQEKP